jgi:integrative and conjugative element protein (TIGR02256 family)
MKILLTDKIVQLLKRELPRAGRREIGGLLMGEHVSDGVFRLVEISVQRSRGRVACFTRHPREHQAQLDKFFARYNHDYTRFNYLGEWHSHPSFPVIPSARDYATMTSIVADPDVGVNFLVLMIVKISGAALEVSAAAFHPGADAVPVEIEVELTAEAPEEPAAEGLLKRLWRIIS